MEQRAGSLDLPGQGGTQHCIPRARPHSSGLDYVARALGSHRKVLSGCLRQYFVSEAAQMDRGVVAQPEQGQIWDLSEGFFWLTMTVRDGTVGAQLFGTECECGT